MRSQVLPTKIKLSAFLFALMPFLFVGIYNLYRLSDSNKRRVSKNIFVLSETGFPTSFDPLESDYSNNIHASQMLYRSILEIDEQNKLTSSLLDSFSYNADLKRITLALKEGQTFSDGTPILAEDVALTIKRMLLRRPSFPVIKHIKGKKTWLEKRNPLTQDLDGISIKENVITIYLTQNLYQPLLRFALPLYGVVKHSSVNRETNELFVGSPTSGFYSLTKKENGALTFSLSENMKSKKSDLVDNIQIIYLKKQIEPAIFSKFKNESVIIYNQEYRNTPDYNNVSSAHLFSRTEQPNSRFSAFLLNPKHIIFMNAACRLTFSNELRDQIRNDSPSIQNEVSLFTRLLPGFIENQGFHHLLPDTHTRNICLKKFRNQTLRWSQGEGHNSQAFEDSLIKATKRLGLNFIKVETHNNRDRYDAFANGKIDILLGGSGFWAFDPVGDTQMLFTPGLHKPLTFVTSDNQIKQYLERLELEDNPSKKMVKFNEYIFKSALLNVFSHSKRVYLSRGKNIVGYFPVASTPPSPWQLFYENHD